MTQNQAILKHLKAGKSITALEALSKFGCLRLSARILEIKQMGYNIERKWVGRNQKSWCEYRLVS